MCAKFGHVLGMPGMKAIQEEMVNQSFAKTCDSHGDPRPTIARDRAEMRVTTFDPNITMAGHPEAYLKDQVSSCDQCANLVTPSAVMKEFGWPFGLCAMSGRLINPTLRTQEAKVCDWRTPKTDGVERDLSGLFLLPAYIDAQKYDPDPIKAFLARRGEPIREPVDHVTDKEVTTEESEAGILSWRRLDDPDGSGNFTFLPIYRTDFFSEAEAAKIPKTGSDEHPEWYIDHAGMLYEVAVIWRELDMTPAVWGEPGTGKTELFRYAAWMMNLPFDRMNLKESSDTDDMIGKMGAVDGEKGTITQFIPGRLVKRWTRPGVLLLDEGTTAPDSIWQALRPIFDNSKQLAIDEDEGQIADRDPDCYIGLANNPSWDIRNIGTRPLAAADVSRLTHFELGLPPEILEREIMKTWCEGDGYKISSDTVDLIMKIAADLRAAAANNTLDTISWGVREQIQVARLTRWFTIEKSYRRAVADVLEPEKREMIMRVVSDHIDPNKAATNTPDF